MKAQTTQLLLSKESGLELLWKDFSEKECPQQAFRLSRVVGLEALAGVAQIGIKFSVSLSGTISLCENNESLCRTQSLNTA